MPEFDRRPQRRSNQQKNDFKNNQVISAAEEKKSRNIFVRFLCWLFPWKGDTAGDVARKLIFIASVCCLVWAAVLTIEHYVIRSIDTSADRAEMLAIRDAWDGPDMVELTPGTGDNTPDIKDPDTDLPASESHDPNSPYYRPPADPNTPVRILGELSEAYELNNDLVGYVEIYPHIRYNVYQSDDNQFYLHHNHNKRPTENGTIFADFEGIFTPTARPHNTILYGHFLVTKDLFYPLSYYRSSSSSGMDSFEFLKQNPIIRFDTLYERGYYKIFAVLQTNIKEEQGEVFNWWDYVYFNNKAHFDNFVADLLDRSMYYTNVDLEYGDELLLLTTCDFSIFANGADSSVRIVVAARRVRDTEFFQFTEAEIDAFIDNRGMDENKKLRRRMFDAYYELRAPAGWAGRNWDTSYIKDFEG